MAGAAFTRQPSTQLSRCGSSGTARVWGREGEELSLTPGSSRGERCGLIPAAPVNLENSAAPCTEPALVCAAGRPGGLPPAVRRGEVLVVAFANEPTGMKPPREASHAALCRRTGVGCSRRDRHSRSSARMLQQETDPGGPPAQGGGSGATSWRNQTQNALLTLLSFS